MYYLDNLTEIIQRAENKKVIIWGYTPISQDLCDIMTEAGITILAFADNDVKKQGKLYKKTYKVLSIDNLNDYKDCLYLISCASYSREIQQQLMNHHISENNIITYKMTLDQESILDNRKIIIITGIGIQNKGAESMALNAVAKFSKNQFKNYNIITWSPTVSSCSIRRKSRYSFPIIQWPSYKDSEAIFHDQFDTEYRLFIKQILEKAEYIFDFSGYTFKSDFKRKNQINEIYTYLWQFIIAAKYGLKIYIMPQSFGKMDFGENDKKIEELVKNGFAKAEVIYAREKSGYDSLRNKYNLPGLKQSIDSVFYADEDFGNAMTYSQTSTNELPTELNNVAIIPNIRLTDFQPFDAVIDLYVKAAKELLHLGKNVYLLSHSEEDVQLFSEIEQQLDTDKLQIIQDINCIEFRSLIQQFDYVIASRYHSIVHALSENTPCVILGWDNKYTSLSDLFHLPHFCFDVSKKMPTIDDFVLRIREMDQNYRNISNDIKNAMTEITKDDIFQISI